MQNTATILPIKKSKLKKVTNSNSTPVKRLLTPEEKEFVSLSSRIIVEKTLRDANEKRNKIPTL